MRGPPHARWRLRPHDPEGCRRLREALGISPIIAQLLINRGFTSPESARAFLEAGERDLCSPFELPHMDRAVDRLLRALRAAEPVVVYGDYDADGVTATAILIRALRAAGGRVDFYVPDRKTEGYGLHVAAVRHLARRGARLIVAVDCGTTAVAAADAARSEGVDLVVLDHHLPHGPLPAVEAIVNPNVSGSPAEYCAAGLAYQAARGLLQAVGREVEAADLVVLAAIGTVADAVPLREDNRIIATHGLARLAATGLPGVCALVDVAGLQPPFGARDLAFGLAPRINAAGRLAHAAAAVRLLVSDDVHEAREIAGDLDHLNGERRALCDRILAEAVEEIEAGGLASRPAIVLAREGWHPGVVGIVASQIVERYYRPTVVVALHGGVGKGSARSIPALHLVDALERASSELTAYGGHAMAAGLTLPAEALPRFRQALVDAVGAALTPEDLEPVIEVDAELKIRDVALELARGIGGLEPFGAGNPPPAFLTRGLRAVGTRTVGGGAHLRLVISDGEASAEAIGFRLGSRAELLAFTQARLDLAYGVEVDHWRDGQTVRLVVEELWTPEVDLEAIVADTGLLLDRLLDRADEYLSGRDGEIEEAPAFHTKVVGVTFEGRQALLSQVRSGDRLMLKRDPANPRDLHAVKVCLADGRQLGFLRASLAARLAPTIDAGTRYTAMATALTGGGNRAWGLNIMVERETPTPRERQPEGGGPPRDARIFDWVTAHLTRGRALSEGEREVLMAAVLDRRLIARLGPGRGLFTATAAAASACVARGRTPVTVILPRTSEVEAWASTAGAWLRAAGIRVLAAHGVMPARSLARSADAMAQRNVDVLAISSSLALDRLPRAAAVLLVVDDVCPESDLTALANAYGPSILLVAGPAPIDRLRAAGGPGAVVSAGGLTSRTHLRLVDHRGQGQAYAAPGTGRAGRTLVVAGSPESAVAEAARLRLAAGPTAGSLAYYHHGLPSILRRVLEDLFAADKISTLVAGSLMIHPMVPADLAHLVAVDLPPTRLLAAEALSAGGAQGPGALVDLRFPAPSSIAAAHDLRHPSRDTLIRCYQYFRGLQEDGGWQWPNQTAPGRPGTGHPAPEALDAALHIFLEAGVVTAEGADGPGVRYVVGSPEARVDLERSLRYRETLRERAALDDVRGWASGPVTAILGDLARP
jgi:single-stranded-DNA-specific exonuclease